MFALAAAPPDALGPPAGYSRRTRTSARARAQKHGSLTECELVFRGVGPMRLHTLPERKQSLSWHVRKLLRPTAWCRWPKLPRCHSACLSFEDENMGDARLPHFIE